jgi:hypothetical protein
MGALAQILRQALEQGRRIRTLREADPRDVQISPILRLDADAAGLEGGRHFVQSSVSSVVSSGWLHVPAERCRRGERHLYAGPRRPKSCRPSWRAFMENCRGSRTPRAHDPLRMIYRIEHLRARHSQGRAARGRRGAARSRAAGVRAARPAGRVSRAGGIDRRADREGLERAHRLRRSRRQPNQVGATGAGRRRQEHNVSSGPIHRQGFRFVARVTAERDVPPADEDPEPHLPNRPSNRRSPCCRFD